MVENSKIIKEFIQNHSKWNPDCFYMVQVIARSKDGHNKSSSVLDVFYINSEEKFDALLPSIIESCQNHNARAYFNLNPKSYRKVALSMLKELADRIASDQFVGLHKLYAHCAGSCSSEYKVWLIDYDGDPKESKIRQVLDTIDPVGLGPKILEEIPTRNGIHYITMPFNLSEFKTKCPGVDVHKNNPTLLYAP